MINLATGPNHGIKQVQAYSVLFSNIIKLLSERTPRSAPHILSRTIRPRCM